MFTNTVWIYQSWGYQIQYGNITHPHPPKAFLFFDPAEIILSIWYVRMFLLDFQSLCRQWKKENKRKDVFTWMFLILLIFFYLPLWMIDIILLLFFIRTYGFHYLYRHIRFFSLIVWNLLWNFFFLLFDCCSYVYWDV